LIYAGLIFTPRVELCNPRRRRAPSLSFYSIPTCFLLLPHVQYFLFIYLPRTQKGAIPFHQCIKALNVIRRCSRCLLTSPVHLQHGAMNLFIQQMHSHLHCKCELAVGKKAVLPVKRFYAQFFVQFQS